MPLKKALLAVLFIGAVTFLGCSSENVTKGGEKVYFFFSPQCPHCENVMPYVENASKKIELEFCQVGKMNEECTSVAKEIGLKGVPTVVYKKESKIKVYIGEKEVKDFMLKVLGGRIDGS